MKIYTEEQIQVACEQLSIASDSLLLTLQFNDTPSWKHGNLRFRISAEEKRALLYYLQNEPCTVSKEDMVLVDNFIQKIV